jgi:hypothetical protein
MSGPLGRRVPTDDEHIRRYPLTTAPSEAVPVTIGVNWYSNFDNPVRDSRGRWWVGRGPLGSIRGGHCVCLPPADIVDSRSWHGFYDQGREGACVGFGSSRMMSLLNRKRYDARWLWNRAKEVDEWPDTNPGDDNGTSVRAAMDVLRGEGHKPWQGAGTVKPGEGIAANRWARTVDEVLGALRSYEGAVPFLNSWGTSYPRRAWMPLETLQRLLDEDGEATVVVDR